VNKIGGLLRNQGGHKVVQCSPPPNRPLSRGGHLESQGNKKLCFCTSSLALNERLDVQNLLFEHCVIKVYRRPATYLGMLNVVGMTDGTNKTRSAVKLLLG